MIDQWTRAVLLTVAVLLAGPVTVAAQPTAGDIIDAASMADEVEAQMGGDFGTMERDPSTPLGQIQDAWDEAPGNAGVYNVAYDPDKVIRLRVRKHMTTTIVFPEWETIGDIYLGDTFVFVAEQTRPNILVTRVSHSGADTSLTVVGATSGHVYTFYLRAVGVNARDVPDVMVRVMAVQPSSLQSSRWSEEGRGLSEEVQEAVADVAAASSPVGAEPENVGLEDPDFLEAVEFDPAKLRFDFNMSGDRTIAPERVFSDGIFTYFDYGDRWEETDLPAIYRVVDGIDTPQNVRYRGSMIVVESAGAFTLRNGQRVVCVRPSGWEPATRHSRTHAPTRRTSSDLEDRFSSGSNS